MAVDHAGLVGPSTPSFHRIGTQTVRIKVRLARACRQAFADLIFAVENYCS